MSGGEKDQNREELLKLYELALQEYRFQVLLNWDRLKHAFVIDGVLVGAAAAIWKLGNGTDPPTVVAWILALASANSVFGVLGSRTGHSYYRETRKVKTTIEQKLGLPESGMALSSTAGMREGHQPETVPLTLPRKIGRWATKVNTYLEVVLMTVAVFAGLEAVVIFRSHP